MRGQFFCEYFFVKLYSKKPILDLQNYLLPCLNKKLFGIDCPGCGTQRALVQVCEGNFVGAFHQFPAIYTTMLFFGFLALHFLDKSRRYDRIVIGLAIANTAIMAVSYFIKMSPFLQL
jgi:hypothetical protein